MRSFYRHVALTFVVLLMYLHLQVPLGANRSIKVRKMACHNGQAFGRDKAADQAVSKAAAAEAKKAAREVEQAAQAKAKAAQDKLKAAQAEVQEALAKAKAAQTEARAAQALLTPGSAGGGKKRRRGLKSSGGSADAKKAKLPTAAGAAVKTAVEAKVAVEAMKVD